jgi:hypothetical protein
MPQGRFHEELVIETDHPKKPEVKVTVAGTVSGPITIFPEQLRLFDVSSRNGATKEVSLLVRGGGDTHFEVMQKPEKLEIDIRRADTPALKGRYIMTVTIPKGTAAGHVEGQIVLKTDCPGVSEVRIPVRILVSRT